MAEIFKIIPDFPNYKVSNFGNVISMNYNGTKKAKMLKKTVSGNGYYSVLLYNSNKSIRRTIHSLVAELFLNHKFNDRNNLIDHIDRNPLNNNVNNLQIISHRLNCSKDKNGTSKFTGVSYRKNRNKWQSEISINGDKVYLGNYDTEYEANLAYKNKLKEVQNV